MNLTHQTGGAAYGPPFSFQPPATKGGLVPLTLGSLKGEDQPEPEPENEPDTEKPEETEDDGA